MPRRSRKCLDECDVQLVRRKYAAELAHGQDDSPFPSRMMQVIGCSQRDRHPSTDRAQSELYYDV